LTRRDTTAINVTLHTFRGMSACRKLHQKYLARFDELIELGVAIYEGMELQPAEYGYNEITRERYVVRGEHYAIRDVRELTRWRVNCVSILDQVITGKSSHANKIEAFDKFSGDRSSIKAAVGRLEAIKEDYERGFFEDLMAQAEAEVAGGYMGQAESLLAEGQPGQFDHVPAAVLVGAVFEKALRTLCDQHDPPIPTNKENGEPKTLDPLITDLMKVDVFNKVEAGQFRGWAQIRNAAAHGEFEKFDRGQVEQRIPGVRDFLCKYLA